MNIDDIVDNKTGKSSPGKKFREQWLDDLPTNQWPSYIDESARLIVDGIFIGETDLTGADFSYETGEYYRRGLAESANIDISNTSLPLGNHSADKIGLVAWTFNQLREEMRNSNYTSYENPSRAIEAAINKSLVEKVESGQLESENLETIRLPESASISTLVSEIFCRPRSSTYIDLLFETIEDGVTSGLLSRIEEPRMVTPLWDHQREALDEWLAHNCRGYVDMATATGKTFLGLAAVAHHFGALHPHDRDLADERVRHTEDERATVIVVAHRDLILDQWKREFDIHLNIPEKSTTQNGEHTAEFEWGDVHFWTPNRLQNADLLENEIDLVVLDETHHYLGSSGFGSLLDDLDGHLLALSGSLDEANARTLERRNIPKLFEFTLRDGQRAGVVPQCDWDIVFTPYENQTRLAETTQKCKAGMEQYAGGVPIPDQIDVDQSELTFQTLSEARSVTQTSLGRELKEHDPEFREFASAVKARQLTKYNLSPSISTVTHLVLDNIDQHKCVVLLETKEEIRKVMDQLQSRLGDSYESLVTVLDDGGDLSAVERFDHNQEQGAIIGVARTLGEGIDIETADVCINRGRGRLSRSLVQRMGRILRNPDGEKEAKFYHISGVATREEALIADEDGVTLLETASQLLDWGEGFRARPIFDVDDEAGLTERGLANLESAGQTAIENWTPEHYEWPTDEGVREELESLCSVVQDEDGSALLSIDRVEHESTSDNQVSTHNPTDEDATDTVKFVAADGGAIEMVGWLYELANAATDDMDGFVEDAVRTYVQETLQYPSSDATPDADERTQIEINPALDAVLSVYAENNSRTAVVHAAVAEAVRDDLPKLLNMVEVNSSQDQIESVMATLLEMNDE
jgi:superfamily II DNA or RNA helicase